MIDISLSFLPLYVQRNNMDMSREKNINQLKAVLAEQNRTSKWLAEQIGKDQATVSKWCTNTYQPSLTTMTEIARLLDVDIRTLLVQTK